MRARRDDVDRVALRVPVVGCAQGVDAQDGVVRSEREVDGPGERLGVGLAEGPVLVVGVDAFFRGHVRSFHWSSHPLEDQSGWLHTRAFPATVTPQGTVLPHPLVSRIMV